MLPENYNRNPVKTPPIGTWFLDTVSGYPQYMVAGQKGSEITFVNMSTIKDRISSIPTVATFHSLFLED